MHDSPALVVRLEVPGKHFGLVSCDTCTLPAIWVRQAGPGVRYAYACDGHEHYLHEIPQRPAL